MKTKKPNATCMFVAADVETIFSITKEQAENWLEQNRKYIEQSMCKAGHEAIENLGYHPKG